MVLSPLADAYPRGLQNQSSFLSEDDVLNAAAGLEQRGLVADAVHVYSTMTDSEEAQARLGVLTGDRGLNLSRAQFLAGRFVDQLTDSPALFAMLGAQGTYRALSPLMGCLPAFAAEAALFPVYNRLGNEALGRPQDWSREGLSHDVQGSFMILGGLKAFGVLGRNGVAWWQQGRALRGTLLDYTMTRGLPTAAMYLGILSGQAAEQATGLAPRQATGQMAAESLATLAHFIGAGRILPQLTTASGWRFSQERLGTAGGWHGWRGPPATALAGVTVGPGPARGSRMLGGESPNRLPGVFMAEKGDGKFSVTPPGEGVIEVRPSRSGAKEIKMVVPQSPSPPPPPEGESERGKAPSFNRGIRVPLDKTIVALGRGAMLTTRGGTDATRSAAMKGIDHPDTLALLAENFGLVRWTGQGDTGQDTWVRVADEQAISQDQIVREFGARLLRESGVREIPLEGNAQGLPVRHGALLPEPFLGGNKLLKWMGLDRGSIKGTPLENQIRNYEYASETGLMGLLVALEAHTGFGFPLHQLRHISGSHLEPAQFGAAQGSAFWGMERAMEIYTRAHDKGRDSITYALQSALLENPRGLYLNTVLPHLDYGRDVYYPMKHGRVREAEVNLSKIIQGGRLPRTGGANPAISAACASGLYALASARQYLLGTGVPGELSMEAMMVLSADATFAPLHTAPLMAGFSRKAPATQLDMLHQLRHRGLLPRDLAEEFDREESNREQIWDRLPEGLRYQAMNAASAPGTVHARGLVGAAGAAAIPWANALRTIEYGGWPVGRLVGIHCCAGQGGGSNLASMDLGVMTALRVSLNMAEAHGVHPRLIQGHFTSTELNNFAELHAVVLELKSRGYSDPVILNAVKALVGHSMGAASGVDLVMALMSLKEGEAPPILNFRPEDIDPSYGEALPDVERMFRFPTQPVKDFGNSIVVLSEGFLMADAAAVVAEFPQEVNAAVDLLRDYGVPEHVRADWKVRAPEHRAAVRELEEELRLGRRSLGDIALKFGFN